MYVRSGQFCLLWIPVVGSGWLGPSCCSLWDQCEGMKGSSDGGEWVSVSPAEVETPSLKPSLPGIAFKEEWHLLWPGNEVSIDIWGSVLPTPQGSVEKSMGWGKGKAVQR